MLTDELHCVGSEQISVHRGSGPVAGTAVARPHGTERTTSLIKVRLFSFPEFEATRAVVTIGVASGALYAAVYALQRALWPLAATSSLRTITALYVVSTLALVVLYGAIVALASNGGLRNARARRLAFAIPVLFSVALTMGRPYLSTDLLTYIAQGHQVRAGQNPYAVPAKALAHTRF